jgi:alkyldihydroxyacetonephosphate synthase
MVGRLKFYGWGVENTGLDEAEREPLFRFVADRLGVEPRLVAPPQIVDISLRAPRLTPPASIAHMLKSDPYERLLHTYGKSYPETVRACDRDFANAPDLVALPVGEADVSAVLDWASGANVAVIPFGCGSSVVGGVEPAVGDSYAGVISLDLRQLGRVLEIDRTSRAARIQAGTRGPAIETALKPHGLSIRHYPQSFEFSTLGGWIATRAGGHFATLYTHIDDFVESIRTVTPAGPMESRRLPGSGAGPSPDRMIIGSEGTLGVIIEAWMRLQHRPRFRGGAVFGFPDLFAAAKAVRAVGQAGLYPSNLRVIDNNEAGIHGVNDYQETLLILAFESADHPVEAWMVRAIELIRDHGGRRHLDESAAVAWRTAFIRMPYTRELTVPLGVINDTFESAVTWDRFEAFHAACARRPKRRSRKRPAGPGLSRPGSPTSIPTVRHPTTPSTQVARPADFSSSGGTSRPAPPMHCSRRAGRSLTTTRSDVITCLGTANSGPPCSAGHSTRPRACSIQAGSSTQGSWYPEVRR